MLDIFWPPNHQGRAQCKEVTGVNISPLT